MSRRAPVKRSVSKPLAVYGGFDLSLTSSGVAFIDGNGKRIYSTSIQVKSQGEARLSEIYCLMNRILTRVNPTSICVEGYSFGSPFNREAVAELGGVIRLLLYEHSIPFVVVQPTSLKKFVLGKGSGAKDLIVLQVYKQWGYEAKTNDEGDAFGLAKIAQCLGGDNKHKLDSEQKAALDEISMSKKEKAARKKQIKLEKAARKAAREAKR